MPKHIRVTDYMVFIKAEEHEERGYWVVCMHVGKEYLAYTAETTERLWQCIDMWKKYYDELDPQYKSTFADRQDLILSWFETELQICDALSPKECEESGLILQSFFEQVRDAAFDHDAAVCSYVYEVRNSKMEVEHA